MSSCLLKLSGFLVTCILIGVSPVFALPDNRVIPASLTVTKGVFLVASDKLNGTMFHRSVILVVSYDSSGTAGVILNKPTEFLVSSTFPNISRTKKNDVFFLGGPVMHKYVFSLVKTKRKLEKTTHVFEDVFFEGVIRRTSSSIRNLQDGEKVRLFVGYSGWGRGQLEEEIARGDWLVKRAMQNDVFYDKPGTLWEDLMNGNSSLWADNGNSGPGVTVGAFIPSASGYRRE